MAKVVAIAGDNVLPAENAVVWSDDLGGGDRRGVMKPRAD